MIVSRERKTFVTLPLRWSSLPHANTGLHASLWWNSYLCWMLLLLNQVPWGWRLDLPFSFLYEQMAHKPYLNSSSFKNHTRGTFLVVQWLRLWLPVQGVGAPSPVWGAIFYRLHGQPPHHPQHRNNAATNSKDLKMVHIKKKKKSFK